LVVTHTVIFLMTRPMRKTAEKRMTRASTYYTFFVFVCIFIFIFIFIQTYSMYPIHQDS